MIGREENEKRRIEYRKQFPDYDKYAKFGWKWWTADDRPRIPDFSGTGKLWKWGTVTPTGKMTVPAMDKDDRQKITTNTWRNTVFTFWYILEQELGKDKGGEIAAKMWLALTTAMEGLEDRYLKGQPRDCVMVSKQLQYDVYYEMMDCDVIEESPDRCVQRYLCTYYGDWKTRWEVKGIDLARHMCGLGCEAWMREFGYKINPDITCERSKWLVAGDPYCEFEYNLVK